MAEFGGRSGPNKLKRVSEFDLEDAKAREKDKKASDKRKANDQRKKQGVSKIIKGIATIVVVALAVAVVVTTAGTATPFVAAGLYSLGVSATTAMTVSSVVVGVAATTTIANAAYTEQCAISDMAEGVQDIAYGQFGVNKKSTNVIRDGLFKGNTKKYETSKAIAGTITEIGIAGFAAIDSVNPYRNSYSYESNKKTNADVDELNNKEVSNPKFYRQMSKEEANLTLESGLQPKNEGGNPEKWITEKLGRKFTNKNVPVGTEESIVEFEMTPENYDYVNSTAIPQQGSGGKTNIKFNQEQLARGGDLYNYGITPKELDAFNRNIVNMKIIDEWTK